VARAVARRAERRLVALRDASNGSELSPLVVYLNRLGDWLFVMARWANLASGRDETRFDSASYAKRRGAGE
jgi:cob(I)alamin adenosyltransferase